MKHFLTFFCTAFIFHSVSLAEKPNVVFFIADDVSQDDFGCYGHPVIQTPHVDALAQKGVRFDNAYLTTSSCSPSRVVVSSPGATPTTRELPSFTSVFPRKARSAFPSS